MCWFAGKVLAGVGFVGAEVGAGAEGSADASQDDDADVGVVVVGPHVFADLGDGAVFLGGADQGVEAFGAVEFDQQDAVVLGFVEQVVDQFGSHFFLC